jgi:hypothetical protein
MELDEKIHSIEKQSRLLAQEILKNHPVYQNLMGQLGMLRQLREEQINGRGPEDQTTE